MRFLVRKRGRLRQLVYWCFLFFFLGQNAQADNYEESIHEDSVICFRVSEGVIYYYGFIGNRWQALSQDQYPEDPDEAILDCDEYYLVPAESEPLS